MAVIAVIGEGKRSTADERGLVQGAKEDRDSRVGLTEKSLGWAGEPGVLKERTWDANLKRNAGTQALEPART
jgi:hypothetical protein